MEQDRAAPNTPDASNPWSKPPGGATRPKPVRAKEVMLYVAGIVAFAILVALIGSALQNIDWEGEAGRRKVADDTFRIRVETDVKRELRDPSSATFRDVFYWAETAAACGEVNGRNGFGGVAGFDRFAYHDGRTAFLSNDSAQYFRIARACQRARILSAKRDVTETMVIVEASSMTDAEKQQSKADSLRSLADIEEQMANLSNSTL